MIATPVPPGRWRVFVAFLIVWLPYITSTALQERLGREGPLGPALMLVSLLLAWPAARMVGGRDPFALRIDRRVLLLFALALVVGLALQAVRWAIGDATEILELTPVAGGILAPSLVAMALITTFVPSLAEDILTRGFPLFAARPVTVSVLGLAALSALLYTANHLWRFDWGVTEQLRLLAMGLAYAAAALRAKSLWAAVGLHWGWNLASALSAPLVSVTAADVAGDRLVGATLHLGLAAAILLFPKNNASTGLNAR